MAVFGMGANQASAIGTSVGLGTAASYSVLAGQTVTNTGPSVLKSNVGVSPGTAISGFPPGVTDGVIHEGDAHSLQAQSDLTTAYNNAAGQASDGSVGPQLGGLTLVPGVYTADSSAGLTGPLTLDAQGDPGAVFIFQIGSALTTASNSSVVLLNDAQSCHVFWQVGSSATLGTGTTFVGTIMALTSITADTGATVEGRALARNGSVTLDSNVFTDTKCATTSTAPPATTTPTPTVTGTPTATGTPTDTGTPTATGTPTGTSTASPTVTATGTPSSEESSTATATPSSTALAGLEGSGGDSAGDQLAYTGGGPSAPVIGFGLGALLAGFGLVFVARRRRTT
jgi:hypothetical protein